MMLRSEKKFEVFTWICLPPRVRLEQLLDMILNNVRSQVSNAW